jgi:dTDP-4-amino-4,6-dideoxygalactose transaminase
MPIGSKVLFTGLKRQYNNLRDETLDVVDSVLSSGQHMNGYWTDEFERWLAARNGVRYAVTCHSGTQALEILAEFARKRCLIEHTPTVLIPSVTYVATANAFLRAGWDVHFIDVDRYGIFDLKRINDVPYYNAVALVGMYGASLSHVGPVTSWQTLYRNDHLVIEDAAQHWLSNDCSRIGIGSAISFDPTKNLANYGNGGAVVTDNPDVAFYAQGWRSNGKKGNAIAGSNSRMSEIDCATMMIKTRYIDQWQQRREQIAQYWISRLANTGIRSLIDDTNVFEHSFHKFVIEIDHRDEVLMRLAQDGIECKIHYDKPLHELPQLHHFPGPGFMSLASSLSRRVLSLPIYPELTDNEVEYIIDRVLAHAA